MVSKPTRVINSEFPSAPKEKMAIELLPPLSISIYSGFAELIF